MEALEDVLDMDTAAEEAEDLLEPVFLFLLRLRQPSLTLGASSSSTPFIEASIPLLVTSWGSTSVEGLSPGYVKPSTADMDREVSNNMVEGVCSMYLSSEVERREEAREDWEPILSITNTHFSF